MQTENKELSIYGEKKGGGHTPIEEKDTLDSKQTLRLLFAVSEGEISGVDDILLNGTSISNYSASTSFEVRTGTADQTIVNGFSEIEAPLAGAGTFPFQLLSGVQKVYSISGAYDAVRTTLMIDRLMSVTGQGDRVGASVSLDIYRRTEVYGQAVGSWQLVTSITKTGKCSNPYSWDVRVQQPAGIADTDHWGLRFVRTSAGSNTDQLYNSTFLSAIITIVERQLTYPKTALVGITCKDASVFGGNVPDIRFKVKGIKLQLPSNYNATTRVYTETTPWNGSFKSFAEYTNNLSWIIYYALCHPSFGMGVSASDLDVGSFYTFAKYCDEMVSNGKGGTEPRYQCDIQFIERLSPAEFFTTLLNLGNANWGQNEYGQIKLVWDSNVYSVKTIFTNADVIDGIFNYSSNDLESRSNLVNVTYARDELHGDSDTVTHYEQTLIDRYGLQTSDIVLLGCKSESQALRKARWALYTNCYQTNVISFGTGIRASMLSIGDVIRIKDSDNTEINPLHAKATSTVINGANFTLTLDRTLVLENASYVMEYLRADTGLYETKAITATNGSFSTITGTVGTTSVPADNATIVFRKSSVSSTLAKVIKITKNDRDYNISALLFNSAKFTYIDNVGTIVVPSDTGIYTNFSEYGVPAVTDLTVDEIYFSTATIDVLKLSINWKWTATSTSNYAPLFDISYSRDNQEFKTVKNLTSRTFDIEQPLPGSYLIYIWAVNPFTGLRSLVTQLVYNFRTVSATSTLLPPVNIYIANTTGTVFSGKDAVITWSYPAANDAKADSLKDYALQVLDFATETVKATYYVDYNSLKGGQFTLSLDQNIGLFGSATRKFKVRLYSRDLIGDYSQAVIATIENTAPVISTFSVSGVLNAAYIKVTIPTDTDLVSYTYRKYSAATGGTALETITIVNNYVDFEATAGTTYYYSVTGNDVYGAGTESTRFSGTAISSSIDTYTYTGLQFTPNSPATNYVSWSSFTAIKNGSENVTVVAGNTSWSTGTLYLYYVPGNTALQSTTSANTAIAAGGRILATYKGGTDLTADAGKAFISGDQLIAGSLLSNALATNIAYITNFAQIGNILQSDNYSNSAGSYAGWRIDKTGAANFNSISVRNSLGNLIFSSGTGLEWSAVTGTGRPADNATVGATIGTNLSGKIKANLLASVTAWLHTGYNSTISYSSSIDGYALKIPNGSNFSASTYALNTGGILKQNTNYTVSFTAFSSVAGRILHFDLFPDTLPEQTFSLTTSATAYSYTFSTASADILLTTVVARFFAESQSGDITIYNPRLEVGTTVSSDISTWIDNAAIGSVQIADAAINNAKIDRASVNKLQVVTADIVDANVSTLKIQGNAVTIPLATYTSSTIYSSGVLQTLVLPSRNEQTAWIISFGATVNLMPELDSTNVVYFNLNANTTSIYNGLVAAAGWVSNNIHGSACSSSIKFTAAAGQSYTLTLSVDATSSSASSNTSYSNRFITALACQR